MRPGGGRVPDGQQHAAAVAAPRSEQRIPAVDHERVAGVIARRRAHQVHRDPAEIVAASPTAASECAASPCHGTSRWWSGGASCRSRSTPAGSRARAHCAARTPPPARAPSRSCRPWSPRSARFAAPPRSPPATPCRPARRPAALHHVPRRRAERVERAIEIDAQHAMPQLAAHLQERCRAAAADAGIGETAIDASHLLQRLARTPHPPRLRRRHRIAAPERDGRSSPVPPSPPHSSPRSCPRSRHPPQPRPSPEPCRSRCRGCRRSPARPCRSDRTVDTPSTYSPRTAPLPIPPRSAETA